MRFSEILQRFKTGALNPSAEISYEYGVAPFKVSIKIKAEDLSGLVKDQRVLRRVLRQCFAQRRINYRDFGGETREFACTSAGRILDTLRDEQKALSLESTSEALERLLGRWETVATEARQRLEESSDDMHSVLSNYRAAALGVVSALHAMLGDDEDNEAREIAEKLQSLRASVPVATAANAMSGWTVTHVRNADDLT